MPLTEVSVLCALSIWIQMHPNVASTDKKMECYKNSEKQECKRLPERAIDVFVTFLRPEASYVDLYDKALVNLHTEKEQALFS